MQWPGVRGLSRRQRGRKNRKYIVLEACIISGEWKVIIEVRGHVPHIFFPQTATVAFLTKSNGGVGFSPVSTEEKVVLVSC